LTKFEFHSYGHALEILGQSFPNEWHEILDSLRKLEITTSDLRMQGGNETNIPKKFDDVLYPYGWREIRITGDLIVKIYPRQASQRGRFSNTPFDEKTIVGYIDGHNIDFIKGKVAFDLFKEKLQEGAQTIGLATGSSPLEFYKQIRESDLDLSNLISVNLDEYVGLTGDDPQSYRYFMEKNLFDAKPFKESYLPIGVEETAEQEVARYNQILEEHPVDLQILGVGRNGHIGFNEPGTSFDSQTHLVQLDASTIEANSRFFDKIEDVPTKAISMGIANILAAKSIVLFAYGESKAQAIKGTVEGEKTEEVPASALQGHPDVTIIADKEALSLLSR